jgi:hypothetical protein
MKVLKISLALGVLFGFSAAYAHCGSCGTGEAAKPGHKHDKPAAACLKKCAKNKDAASCKKACKTAK